MLPDENRLVRKLNASKTQNVHRIRLLKFIFATPLEHNYNKQKFRPDDKIVIPQDDLYSIAWEAESDASPLDCPTVDHDLLMTKHTSSRNSVTQKMETTMRLKGTTMHQTSSTINQIPKSTEAKVA